MPRLTLAALVLALGASGVAAQPVAFGSADDLFERGSGRAEADGGSLSVFGGAAYLPDTWRGAVRGRLELARGPVSASVAATLHPAAGGLYGNEADEPYDALRAVEYVRLNPSPGQPVYARLGPTEYLTLGVGALARGYRTTAAWDERLVGLEAAVVAGPVTVAAFSDDVRFGSVVGGEVGVQTGIGAGPLRGIRATIGAVHDLGEAARLTGAEATLQGSLAGGRFAADAPFGIAPFVTAAFLDGKGHAVGAGADLDAFRFSEALRARVRAAVFVSSARFVPGVFGPFYSVSNADARIASGLTTAEASELVGTPLDSLRAGVDAVVDVRLVAFGRFEVSQYLRRHIGADRASAYSLRLAARLPQNARAEFALERQGFRGLWSLLTGGLGDQNTLVLDVSAPLGGRTQAFVRSRYGYRRLDGDGAPRYLAERRFEPLVGLRLGLR